MFLASRAQPVRKAVTDMPPSLVQQHLTNCCGLDVILERVPAIGICTGRMLISL
jgi:hypothetical protein